MWVNGEMIRGMDRVYTFGQMELHIVDFGRMMRYMGKERWFTRMEIVILAFLSGPRNTEWGPTFGLGH